MNPFDLFKNSVNIIQIDDPSMPTSIIRHYKFVDDGTFYPTRLDSLISDLTDVEHADNETTQNYIGQLQDILAKSEKDAGKEQIVSDWMAGEKKANAVMRIQSGGARKKSRKRIPKKSRKRIPKKSRKHKK